MKTSIICVGTELLFGQTVNTNATYLSKNLNQMGFDVMYHFVVGDNPARLREKIAQAYEDTDLILLTGGLMRFDDIREGIEKHCGFIAPIFVYPGELEQSALALPALKALRGELEPRTYSGKNVWSGFDFLND
jgi:molybdenum cofactor synthesis domain-containing protein